MRNRPLLITHCSLSRSAMNVVLISTYELGHQPFGLTSAAAWLKREGAEVVLQDAAVQHLDKEVLAAADLIGYYVPMHTATRIAAQFIPTIKAHNPRAHVACFGLYAPMNEVVLAPARRRYDLGRRV